MNGSLKFSIPRNECTSWVSTRAGSLVKASTLSGLVKSPLLEKITPKNLMLSLLNSHFLRPRVSLQSCKRCKTLIRVASCSSWVTAWMRMSS